MDEVDFLALQKIIGYEFRDKQLLQTALTHASYGNQHNVGNYQRLEFLGDSILNFVVAEQLFCRYSDFDEGKLSTTRASLVSRQPLANIVEESGLIDFIISVDSSSSFSQKVVSDMFESIVGAIYLDSNDLGTTRDFIIRMMEDILSDIESANICDYKTCLKEFFEGRGKKIPQYIDAGFNEETRVFAKILKIDGEEIKGFGKSKKIAEMQCARQAIKKLKIKV